MTVNTALFCVLLLESISGTLCYDYDVGGMVAASLAGFIFLIAITIILIVAILWRDWYMKRQARKGRYRVPREKWRLFKYSVMKKSGSPEGTPRSGRRMNMQMYNLTPGSRVTTLERQEPITDAWVTRLPPVEHYEEKSKTLKFEPEEEHYIVADVLPENTPRSQPTMTYQQDNSATMNYTTNTDATTAYVRQTAPADRVSYEPYHVRVQMSQASSKPTQQLSQTTRPSQQFTQTTYSTKEMSQTTRPAQVLSKTVPTSRSNDIFIQPQIPASNSQINQAGVVVFDSDDEAGNIPAQTRQSEDIVLF